MIGSRNGLPRSAEKAPRLYCDICEEFDVHDTDDCPVQCSGGGAADERDDGTHSKHHGARNQQRPYCDNCEEFSHATEDCDADQTF